MRSDRSDRRVEVFRHAIIATMSLIPVFGIQFLFLIYRPRYWPPYEIIVAIFESSQGTLVAVLYCFTTKEVKNEFRSVLRTGRSEQGFFQMQTKYLPTGTTNSVKFAMTILPPPLSPPPSQQQQQQQQQPAVVAATPEATTVAITAATTTSATIACDHIPGRTATTRCRMLCGRHSLTRSKPGRADVIEEIETSTNRRDSCLSRTTQRSYADSMTTSIVSQHKLELRKNSLVRTMAHNLDTSSPETAELIPPDGGSRKMRI
ncbi:hypothetical protein LSH36_122g01002 [Paralvinella palmiformis]|uniref:G-protein coupled receptors family 2 profile 2 domain-containing protein n=1 Tax=Paralvinella palmiformis TaxID=53620 RepID=A0AAD9NAH1_9ANNE|nr:hypothetical protein LSH36_122g01002 [Paralvinella palmiformis]